MLGTLVILVFLIDFYHNENNYMFIGYMHTKLSEICISHKGHIIFNVLMGKKCIEFCRIILWSSN